MPHGRDQPATDNVPMPQTLSVGEAGVRTVAHGFEGVLPNSPLYDE
jgi:hypothetical protein